MDDRDFFDLLFQQFAKTTQAETAFWMPERNDDADEKNYLWDIFAVGQDEKKRFVGGFQTEVDADFITAVHGCFPDLVRRLHAALDEADRLDVERDEAEQKSFSLAMEVEELRNSLATARAENSYHRPLG